MLDDMDTKLIGRITQELDSRSLLKIPQMSPKEQIHWIMEDINWDRVRRVEEFIKLETGQPFLPITIDGMKHQATTILDSLCGMDENDYETNWTQRGNFVATRSIYDGVCCISLKYVVAGWDMDYDCVTSQNYDDEEYKGEIDD